MSSCTNASGKERIQGRSSFDLDLEERREREEMKHQLLLQVTKDQQWMERKERAKERKKKTRSKDKKRSEKKRIALGNGRKNQVNKILES